MASVARGVVALSGDRGFVLAIERIGDELAASDYWTAQSKQSHRSHVSQIPVGDDGIDIEARTLCAKLS